MDRRLHTVILVAAALSCGGRRSTSAPPPDAAAPPPLPAAPPPEPDAPDAAPEELAQPPEPLPVLSGPAAEQVIAETVIPRAPPPPDAPELRITPKSVGSLVLGMSRREVTTLLGRRVALRRLRTPPGEVSVELGAVAGPTGARLLGLRIYGGRLTEITVEAHDPRARTESDIGIGSTFDEATLAHGAPRRSGPGYVLEALPGVIFVPEGGPSGAAPDPAARVGRVIVVGPESD